MQFWRSIKIFAPRAGLVVVFFMILALFFQLLADHIFGKRTEEEKRERESLDYEPR